MARGGEVTLSAGEYQSFVVRVWVRQQGGGMVYGRITHVGSHETKVFRTAEEMLAFMCTYLGAATIGHDAPTAPAEH